MLEMVACNEKAKTFSLHYGISLNIHENDIGQYTICVYNFFIR